MSSLSLRTFISLALGIIATVHAKLPKGSRFGIAGENAAYDYVVVGGGTSGLTLATRLAQDGRYSVAVLEAGGFPDIDNGNHSSVPGYAFAGLATTSLHGVNPKVDWMDMTTPQFSGIPMHYAQGKCLGGSSVRNLMVYQRPTVGSMKRWADEVDDRSWSWENVLPFFKKSTSLTPPDVATRGNATPSYDSSVFASGPLKIGFANYVAPFASIAKKAFESIGERTLHGVASGQLLGYSYITLSLDSENQERSSSQTSFLDLALQQTSLVVYTGALAKRILFDTDKGATGVTVATEGVLYNITAKREVILSAGAFCSPQLLMVSGVGDKDCLKHHGITPISHRPGVGQNLEDNPLFGISIPVSVESAVSYMFSPQRFVQAIDEYNTHRAGYLTSPNADLGLWLKAQDFPKANFSERAKADLASFPADWPDVQFFASSFYLGPVLGSMPPDLQKSYVTFTGGLLTPLSRGTVDIRSADTADPPFIDPAWLTNPTDQEVVVHALQYSRTFLDAPAIKSIMLGDETYPGANVTSYEDLLEVVRKQTGPFYHAAATCKMGRASDRMAVVDSKHRVFGVKGLRVVDMSAVPFLPPGQPQSVAYMLAEKAAEEILHGSPIDERQAEFGVTRDEL